jgi:hypothetical protein
MLKRLFYVAIGIFMCGVVAVVIVVWQVLNYVPTVPTLDKISAEIGIRIPATATDLRYDKKLFFNVFVCVRFQVTAAEFQLFVDENRPLTTDSLTTAERGETVSLMKNLCDADWWEPESFANGDCYKQTHIPVPPNRRKSIYVVADDARSKERDADSGEIIVHILYVNEPG